MTDDPQREEMERQLDLLREAQEMGRYSAFDWDPQSDTFTRSEAAFALLGVSPAPAEPSWADFMACVHPDDREHVQQKLTEVFETGVHPEVRYRVVWPDEQVRHIVSRGRVLEEHGDPVRLVGFIQDETERIRDQRQIRRQSRLLEEAQRLGRMGAWSFDVRSGDLTWSAATYAIYGVEQDTPVTFEVAVAGLSEADQARARRLVDRAIQDHRPYEDRFEIVRPDGSRVLAYVVARIEVIDGHVQRIYGFIQDVTDQERRFEERLRLDRLQSLSQVASGLAHDLNNYLTATALALSVLDRTSLATDEQEGLKDALAGLRAGRSAANRLLAFASHGPSERATLDLCQLVPDVARFTLRGRDAGLEVDAPGGPVLVVADRGQLEQVISNLVLNAAQAMEDRGTVSLRIAQDDEAVWFEVADEGPGISQDLRERVFEPYVTTKRSGTGLGLATCRAVVERHDGRIEILPSDRGARFRVTLPAALTDRKAPPESVDAPDLSVLAGTTVLVYDDQAPIRRLVARILPDHGAQVVTCARASEVRDVAARGVAVDLAILDATLPGETGGIQLAPRLRTFWPSVRLVLSSGYASADAEQVDAAGFDAVLPKPYALDGLLAALVRALQA